LIKGKNYETRNFVIFFTHLSLHSVSSKHLFQIYFTVQIDLDKTNNDKSVSNLVVTVRIYLLQLYFSYKYHFYKTCERICLPTGIFLPLRSVCLTIYTLQQRRRMEKMELQSCGHNAYAWVPPHKGSCNPVVSENSINFSYVFQQRPRRKYYLAIT